MFKKALTIASTVVLFLGLAACSSGDKEKSSGGNEKVTIEFMHSQVEQERVQVVKNIIAGTTLLDK